MVRVKPFRGLRPPAEMAAALSAPPYDVINSDEARELMKTAGETSFLRVNKPEVDLPPEINQYDVQVYERGKQNLKKFLENGWLVPDKTPCFYIYAQKMGEHLQTGIVAGVPVEDYALGVIKRHEKTQVKKENDRTRLTHVQNANAGPVFLTYRTSETVDEIVGKMTRDTPEVQFRAEGGTEHSVWVVRDPVDVFAIQKAFEGVKTTYIADGHHRSASAFRVGEMKIKEAVARGDVVTGEEPFNFFLAVLFPSNQLLCMEYNRVVRDLAGFSDEDFLERVSVNFEVSKTPEGSKVEPGRVREMAMCLRGSWYTIRAKEGTFPAEDVVKSLDVQILYDNLLNPVLNIGNPRADERIKYVGGIRGSNELRRLVTNPAPEEGSWAVAFCMFPVSVDQVMRVADADQLMPPKATWFEPKLRSGLVVRSLDSLEETR
ncbi:unnamed protein product [Ectocarpus sp. CCAP 1310/34]|nr:unnamed protein product [Ectocarpus sp. CCAP 1310/34]